VYCFTLYFEKIAGTIGNYEQRYELIEKINDLMKRIHVSYGKKIVQLKLTADNGLPILF